MYTLNTYTYIISILYISYLKIIIIIVLFCKWCIPITILLIFVLCVRRNYELGKF